MAEETYEGMKKMFKEVGYNPAAVEVRLATWLEANPDKGPKAKKAVKKVDKKVDKKEE